MKLTTKLRVFLNIEIMFRMKLGYIFRYRKNYYQVPSYVSIFFKFYYLFFVLFVLAFIFMAGPSLFENILLHTVQTLLLWLMFEYLLCFIIPLNKVDVLDYIEQFHMKQKI